ncbi:MAG: CTP synthase [bacterium]|nr:CTP synthase [bacterium]
MELAKRKFIFVSGGVVSGVGKGVTTSSLALLIKSRGYTISPIKCDMYVNVDAGTMNPAEHGEVFVTADGIETDQDLGSYERFLNQQLSKKNYTTTGQVYLSVIQKERQLYYKGRCVEVVPDIPEEIVERILEAGKDSEFTIIELGGTVGEYQSVLFLEATRMLAKRLPHQTIHIHVSYFPFLKSIGEIKSKPTQLSIRKLNESGILPDFVVARSEKAVDRPRFNTLCQNSNLTPDQIIFCSDVGNVYEVPLILEQQHFTEKVLEKLGVTDVPAPKLDTWKALVEKGKNLTEPALKIGVIEKYRNVGDYTLADTHLSVLEAVRHASLHTGQKYEIVWVNSEESEGLESQLANLDGIIVPQAWGSRGYEGKINAIKYARTHNIPFLGLCYGMQMAVVEYGRNVVGLENATSTEIDANAQHQVIHIMLDQVKKMQNKEFGGTIRLGAYPCKVKEGSRLYDIYQQIEISERHRHRYEFNNDYRQKYEETGMVFSGLSPDGTLVESVEIPEHPFFIGVQFHPEYQSTFERPHPLFVRFLESSIVHTKAQ